MSVTVRLYDGTGKFLRLLPQASSVSVQAVLNEEGAGSINYPAKGQGADLLRQLGETAELADCMAAVHLDGKEIFRFLLDDDEDDEAAPEANARQMPLGGPGTLAVMARGVVLPEDGIGAVPATHKFENQNAGQIMLKLLGAMQRLGYLTQIQPSFTTSRDSAGQPWDTWIDVEYEAGKDLLTVVKDLAVQGCCDVRMRALTLDMFNPNTVLAQDKPGIYVRRAHAQSAPRKRSRRALRTDYLVLGDEGVNTLRFNSDARELYGKRLGFVSEGNTISASALHRAGDEALKETARPSTGYSLSLNLGAQGCPQPYADFQMGDSIRSDFAMAAGGGYEPLRVKAITTSFSQDGVTSCSLEVNDRFTESVLNLSRKIEGIRHGKFGTSRPPTQPPGGTDTTVPKPPASVAVVPQLSYTAEGNTTASMVVAWPPVVTNADSAESELKDLAHYEIRYLLPDFQPEGPTEPDEPDEPEPEPQPDEPVVRFVDGFARPNSPVLGNGWVEAGGNWDLRNETIFTQAGGAAALRLWQTTRTRYRIDASVAAEAGNPSVVMRGNPAQGIAAGYVAFYSPTNTGSNIEIRKNGKAVLSKHHGPANNRIGGGEHLLSMELDTKTKLLVVYLDDVEVARWTDTGPLPPGHWVGVATIGKVFTACGTFTVTEWLPPALSQAVRPLTADFDGDGFDDGPTPPEEEQEISPSGVAYTSGGTTTETSALITGLPTKTRVQVEVRAVDTSNNKSPWAVSDLFTTPGDGAEPPPPAAPNLEARLGGLQVTWPETSSDGGALPPNYSHVEVHSAERPTYLPSPATRLGTMIGKSGFFTNFTPGLTIWVRLVMVDRQGRRSAPSPTSSIIITGLVSTDIGIGAVLARNLATGAVTSDKLTVGALGDSMLLNPSFEERTDSGLPVSWVFGVSATGSYSIDATLPKDGSLSVKMRGGTDLAQIPNVTSQQFYPVTAGEWYYSHAWFRGSAGTAAIRLLWFDAERVRIVVTPDRETGTVVALNAAWRQSIGLKQAPDAARYVRVQLYAPNSHGTDVWGDACDLRPATGRAQILNAAIGAAQIEDLAVQRAKIATAAVGDAQIGSMSVTKLIAGELTAQYVTVRGRLTSQREGLTGAGAGGRWELDGDGLRSYSASGVETATWTEDGKVRFTDVVVEGGEIEGARITGGVVTGTVMQTAEDGKRVELSSVIRNRINFYGGAASADIDPSTTPAFIEVEDYTNAGGYRGPAMRIYVPGSNVKLPSTLRLDGDSAKLQFGQEPTTPPAWTSKTVLIGYNYPAFMTYREFNKQTGKVVSSAQPGYIPFYNKQIIHTYPNQTWPSVREWPDIPVDGPGGIYVMRAFDYVRQTRIPVYQAVKVEVPPSSDYSYVRVQERRVDVRGDLYSNKTISSGTGMFDTGNRVYSATNPPPAPSFRNRDIYGSELAGGPLFTAQFGDYSHRFNYIAGNSGGNELHAFASPLIAKSHFFSPTSPVLTAGASGGIVVARTVTANGVTLSSSRQHKDKIEPMGAGLSKLRQLRAVTFDRVNDANGRKLEHGVDHECGFIAEEVADVMPEVSPDGQSVDVMALIGALVKSVQELADQVDAIPKPMGPVNKP